MNDTFGHFSSLNGSGTVETQRKEIEATTFSTLISNFLNKFPVSFNRDRKW